MKIRRMTAFFGRLQGETLSPGPGLNIIYAPNEGGKTTWCAFLRAMLYGIDTKERDTRTALAEKNRWQPWSGGAMEGEMVLVRNGRELILRRFSRGGVPFGAFSAIDAATGQEHPGLSAAGAGEALLGVSRGVYERSAFIGQGRLPFNGEQELEKRIAALVSSGEETVSYSQAEQRLRQWQRRRKYNRTGLIPGLEEELAELDRMLERAERARSRQEYARQELERLKREEGRLEDERRLHGLFARRELDERLARAYEALADARAQEDCAREKWAEISRKSAASDLFSGMTHDEAWTKAVKDAAEADRMAAHIPVIDAVCLALLAGGVAGVLAALLAPLFVLVAAAGFLGAAFRVFTNKTKAKSRADTRAALLARYGASRSEEILEAAARYREACVRTEKEQEEARFALESAQARRQAAQQLCDALVQSGARPDPAPVHIEKPKNTPEETEERLAAVKGEIFRVSGDFAMAAGELNTMDSPAALMARREEGKEELARRIREHEALTLALEQLAEANSELQARFSPTLNARAGQLMAAMTDGKYDRITLSRDFQAAAGEAGGIVPRRAMTLSQGTADQLYLSVRLAVCELALPGEDPAPLVLDDALTCFDQARMERALDLLREMGETRQILLFTCHRREGNYLAQAPGVTHIDL